jgi:DNA topoisomerase-3
MRLVVAEKPSVAKEIARALGCTRREAGFFAGPDALVTYAIGHLVRFAEPDEMNPAWGKPWRREALPMVPASWKFVAEPGTKDQFAIVKRLMLDKRIAQIVNATDAGREGEAIFRRIYTLAGAKKPVLRFWTSSLTEEAIAQALTRLRPASEYDNLGAAALARAQLDWLIGMNHTRASTLNNHQLCSVGRVQTPTLAMIVSRHHQIANFIETSFFEVHAEFVGACGAFVARALNAQGKYDFEQREQAEAILADLPEGTPAEVTAIEKKPKRTPPPQLHNLGELQKEANRRFGLTADRTLQVAQALYEQKAITYPRSSSRYLSEDMVSTLPGILRALHLGGRDEAIAQALQRARGGPKLSKRFVDGSKLSDHHAIIPTAKPAPASLGQDERRVYTLVAERFLAIFLPDRETEETRIDVLAAGHRFRATGTRLVAAGWSVLTGNRDFSAARAESEEETSQALPEVKKGERLTVLDAELVTKARKPPPRFTDASLLSAMETAGRELDDDALREAMRGRGLGTEATRASILKRLLDLEYVVRDGKHFDPTSKGIALIAQLLATLPHLASPELTGDMEARLEQVEQGKLAADDLLADVARGLVRDIPVALGARPIEVVATRKDRAGAPAPEAIKAAKGELVCPSCRAGLLSQKPGQAFYGCGRFRDGCTFTLQAVVAKKKLSASQVRELVVHHKTKVIRGFKSNAGKAFDAALVLEPENGWRTRFEFER